MLARQARYSLTTADGTRLNPADLDRLAALRADAAAWISREHDSPQWSTPFDRLTVDRRYVGQGIGARLADWGRWRAATAGAELVRANAWSDNTALHAYYRAYGWRLLRIVEGSRSGALFEMPVRRTPAVGVYEVGQVPLLS
ncbi:GNAT family N-acetyltransferase [Kitasatospora sp. NPDC048296]|uniref:GNAT family N-acetyltransferase n=1 Tax=Kitasatospora sp. NPDC048296 TaxID=3364048 RepID=UPI003710D193